MFAYAPSGDLSFSVLMVFSQPVDYNIGGNIVVHRLQDVHVAPKSSSCDSFWDLVLDLKCCAF